jgi:hypothetical protein
MTTAAGAFEDGCGFAHDQDSLFFDPSTQLVFMKHVSHRQSSCTA